MCIDIEMVTCSLCTLDIDGQCQGTVRYPACGHVIHLRCFVNDPDFVFFVSDCKTCVLYSFKHPEQNSDKGRRSNTTKMPSAFPPRGLDIKDHVKQSFALPGGILQNPISDMGDSYKRQASHIDMVSSGLQQEYSNKATGFRSSSSSRGSEQKMRQGKSFANFVDTINSDFGATMLVLAKGEDRQPPPSNSSQDSEYQNAGPSRTLALPYEIGGIQTWVSTRSEKHTVVAADLRAGKYMDTSILAKHGFSVLNMIETGLSLHTLMNVNNYTLQELTGYGFTWAGFVAIGLTMDYFKMEGIFIDINVLIQYFPGLSVYDLITLPPANVTPLARLEVFTSLDFNTKILLLLRFDIPSFADTLTAQSFLNLGKKIPLDDITGKLHLHGEILRAKDLLNKGFFKAMGWSHPLKYITHVLGVNETSIDQYGLLDEDVVAPQSVIKESSIATPPPPPLAANPGALGIVSMPMPSATATAQGYGSIQQEFLSNMENPQKSNIIGRHNYHGNRTNQYRGTLGGYSTSAQ